MQMAISLPFLHLQAFFLVFFSSSTSFSTAQSPAAANTDFSCTSNSTSSCPTYITYRAQAPDYMDLGHISDLFGVSRLSIATASNLSSEGSQLVPHQLLLIPITCRCNGSIFSSNATYKIKQGDSFYFVSIHAFENLTNYHLVEQLNPTLIPTNLSVGTDVVFPLLCKCPSKEQVANGIQYFITYVWQPDDVVSLVSNMFQASPVDVVMENNYRNFSAAVCLPVVIPVAKFPVLSQPHTSAGKHKSNHHLILIAVLGTAAAFIVVTISVVLAYSHILHKRKKSLHRKGSSLETSDLLQSKKLSRTDTFEGKLLPGLSGYLGKPVMYEKKKIMDATMNLSERFRIGGSVYRAMMDDHIFAIKKFKDATEELKILQRVNHANLIKLMGVSLENDGTCFLVYEYAENGSLDNWLFTKSASLSWSQRLHVALDIANGLQYLHEHTQPSIIHGDIRTSNILVDSRFKAKIANFNTARHATNSVMLKVDVFSFGIILLELLSGKKAVETRDNDDTALVWKEMREILEIEEERQGRLSRWMGPKLEGFYPIDAALNLAALAVACSSENVSARPTMSEIVFNLSILTQSSSEMYERTWITGLEAEDTIEINNAVIAR